MKDNIPLTPQQVKMSIKFKVIEYINIIIDELDIEDRKELLDIKEALIKLIDKQETEIPSTTTENIDMFPNEH